MYCIYSKIIFFLHFSGDKEKERLMTWIYLLSYISGISIFGHICYCLYHCFLWCHTRLWLREKNANSPTGATTPRSPTQAITEPRRRPHGTWSRINLYIIQHVLGRKSDEEQSNDNERAANDDHSTVVNGSDFEDITSL